MHQVVKVHTAQTSADILRGEKAPKLVRGKRSHRARNPKKVKVPKK